MNIQRDHFNTELKREFLNIPNLNGWIKTLYYTVQVNFIYVCVAE